MEETETFYRPDRLLKAPANEAGPTIVDCWLRCFKVFKHIALEALANKAVGRSRAKAVFKNLNKEKLHG